MFYTLHDGRERKSKLRRAVKTGLSLPLQIPSALPVTPASSLEARGLAPIQRAQKKCQGLLADENGLKQSGEGVAKVEEQMEKNKTSTLPCRGPPSFRAVVPGAWSQASDGGSGNSTRKSVRNVHFQTPLQSHRLGVQSPGPTTCWGPALQPKSEHGQCGSQPWRTLESPGGCKPQRSGAWPSRQRFPFNGAGVHPGHQNFKPGYVSGTWGAPKACHCWLSPWI